IQLDPEGTERIDTEADAAFGESRLQVEYEALAPLVPLGLGSTLTAEMPVVIKVAQLEVGLGVTEHLCQCNRGCRCHSAGQQQFYCVLEHVTDTVFVVCMGQACIARVIPDPLAPVPTGTRRSARTRTGALHPQALRSVAQGCSFPHPCGIGARLVDHGHG